MSNNLGIKCKMSVAPALIFFRVETVETSTGVEGSRKADTVGAVLWA